MGWDDSGFASRAKRGTRLQLGNRLLGWVMLFQDQVTMTRGRCFKSFRRILVVLYAT